MAEEKPVIYILRGDDQQAINAHVGTFYTSLGEGDMAEMNTSRLDGKTASLNDLRSAVLALPFLTERRLVIVEDALQPYSGKGGQKAREAFLELLVSLPASTALVLIVPDALKYSYYAGSSWATLKETHWLTKWVKTAGKRAMIVDCALPTEDRMPLWIQKKAADLGGAFTQQAAQLLRDYIGNDTRHAVQEITKLLTFVDFQRPVDVEDVSLLTVRDQQSDIFAMVDAIGSRNGKKALELLQVLLDESDFIYLFGMVIRQFRLLIQAREILDLQERGLFKNPTQQNLNKALGVADFVAKKAFAQARNFDLPMLESIYHQLLDIDLGEKTGRMPGEVALELLITRLAN